MIRLRNRRTDTETGAGAFNAKFNRLRFKRRVANNPSFVIGVPVTKLVPRSCRPSRPDKPRAEGSSSDETPDALPLKGEEWLVQFHGQSNFSRRSAGGQSWTA